MAGKKPKKKAGDPEAEVIPTSAAPEVTSAKPAPKPRKKPPPGPEPEAAEEAPAVAGNGDALPEAKPK